MTPHRPTLEELYSDQTLEDTIRHPYESGPGFVRAAQRLLRVPFAERYRVDTEARVVANVVGGRYADCVAGQVYSYLRNPAAYATPYTDANTAMLKREKAAREQGRPATEPMVVTFAGLTVHPDVTR